MEMLLLQPLTPGVAWGYWTRVEGARLDQKLPKKSPWLERGQGISSGAVLKVGVGRGGGHGHGYNPLAEEGQQ